MWILYIETNYLMAIAKRREPQVEDLFKDIQESQKSVRIVIPAICYIEALSTLEQERNYVKQFDKELDKQINNSERDQTSDNAKDFLASLQKAKLSNDNLLNDFETRLSNAIEILLERSELIQLEQKVIKYISQVTIRNPKNLPIQNDIMDNLILRSIFEHANSHSKEVKAFLSGNTKDFGKQEVQTALRNAGVNKYFTKIQDFLGWLQSQNSGHN